MLTKENFNESHIRMLQKQSKKDPALLERAVFAFGLLEAIRQVEMPFIFKGGTCLLLLLKHQRYFHLNNVRNRYALAETALKRGILNLLTSLRSLEKIFIFFWIFYLKKILMPEW